MKAGNRFWVAKKGQRVRCLLRPDLPVCTVVEVLHFKDTRFKSPFNLYRLDWEGKERYEMDLFRYDEMELVKDDDQDRDNSPRQTHHCPDGSRSAV